VVGVSVVLGASVVLDGSVVDGAVGSAELDDAIMVAPAESADVESSEPHADTATSNETVRSAVSR